MILDVWSTVSYPVMSALSSSVKSESYLQGVIVSDVCLDDVQVGSVRKFALDLLVCCLLVADETDDRVVWVGG